VLTKVEHGRSGELDDLVRLTNLRHNAEDTNLTLVIVDGVESLLATREWEAVRQAAWSNLDSYVAAMSLVFEDYWSKGKPAQQRFMELSTQQNIVEITETLKRALEDDGWKVSLPGELVGSSDAPYAFSLTASHTPSSRRLGLNLSLGDDAFNKVIEMSARKLDVGEASLILASIKPLDDEIQKLAGLYGISLVQAYDPGELAKKVMGNLKPLV
jgi:hypothetical protein